MEISYILPIFIAGIKGSQFIIVIVLAILVFGGVKKIPELMRNLGKGVHSFKQGMEDAKEEMNKPVKKYVPKDEKEPEEDSTPRAKDVD